MSGSELLQFVIAGLKNGSIYALVALAGAVTGAALFGVSYERLRVPFGLPSIGKPAASADHRATHGASPLA